MEIQKKFIVLILFLALAAALFVQNRHKVIQNVGYVVIKPSPSGGGVGGGVYLNVDVYTNSSKTSKVEKISWGELYPGQTKSYTVYIFNSGNAPLVLSLSTENWQPENASQYITLQWSYNGEVIQPNSGVNVTFYLTVDVTYLTAANVKDVSFFSFNIVIFLSQQ